MLNRAGVLALAFVAAGCNQIDVLASDQNPSGSDAGSSDLRLPDAGAVDMSLPDLKCARTSAGGGLITFDNVPANTMIRDQYAHLGILFSSTGPGDGPRSFAVFSSPVSTPNSLTGDDETVDLDPGTEHGNNQPALAITMTFVDPSDKRIQASTPTISFSEVYTNLNNVTRADGYDATGAKVASAQIMGTSMPQTLSLAWPAGLNKVVVSFDQLGTGGYVEDNAGIDDVRFPEVTASCP